MAIAIIGAGIAGLATAWALTKRGMQVTIFEQGAIPNPLSASGDQHRMIRRAYSGLDGYGEMITEAFEAWDELWADLGESHYRNRGVLAINQYPNDFGVAFAASMRRGGHAFEALTPGEAAARYPFLDPTSFREAYYSPEGGPLLCRRIGAGLAAWLERHGAELRPFTRVASVMAPEGRLTLETGETLAFDHIIVAAGAWVLRLFPSLADRLTVCRTIAAYVRPPADLEDAWNTAPAVQSIGGILSGYILPPGDGTGLKFAAGSLRRLTGDGDALRQAEPDEGERLRSLFSPPLARVEEYAVEEVVTCAYTFTEDLRFLSEDMGRTLVVSPCSGHGYKFGAAVGRRVAEAVTSGDNAALSRWLRAEASLAVAA